MQAAVFHGRRDVRVEDVAAPAVKGGTDVLLDVLACGICGTDAAEWAHGPLFVPLAEPHPGSGHRGPTVLGHELVGRVRAVGPSVCGLTVGDVVVSGGGSWCGECHWCQAGRYNLCQDWWVIGLSADGALAEQVVAPEHILVPVPPGLPPTTAVLAQPLAVAVHAVSRSGLAAGNRVLVIGSGAIGSLVVAACAARQLDVLVAVDINPDQLAMAAALGASATFLADATLPARVAAAVPDGSFDVVIETSGTAAGLATATALVERGGTILVAGLQEPPSELDLHDLARREISLITTLSQINPVDVPAALRLLENPAIAATLVRHVIGLEDVVTAGIEPLHRGELIGKAIIVPSRDDTTTEGGI
jgi:(R,R)-butanediol dehydrogenase / meso-butanediol dehydrogenase / diacetyl reductase